MKKKIIALLVLFTFLFSLTSCYAEAAEPVIESEEIEPIEEEVILPVEEKIEEPLAPKADSPQMEPPKVEEPKAAEPVEESEDTKSIVNEDIEEDSPEIEIEEESEEIQLEEEPQEEIIEEEPIVEEEPPIEDEVLPEEEEPEESNEEELVELDEKWENRKIELYFIKSFKTFGDTVIFGYRLIDFPPIKNLKVQWQYSEDNSNWKDIPGATGDTLEVTITRDNYQSWWRIEISYDLNI